MGSSGLNNGRAFLHLKDRPDRPWTDSPAYDRLVARYGHVAILGDLVRFVRPLFEHHLTIDEVMAGLQPKLNRVTGMRVFHPPTIRIGGQFTKLDPVHAVEPGYRTAL